MAHAHGHSHGPVGAAVLSGRRADSRRRMALALAINLAILAAEAVGGIVTGSLALLADAGHLFSDVGAIGLALVAAALAARPTRGRRTFGFQRTEVLAALVNGLLLVAVAVLIAVAAIMRLDDPPHVAGAGVLVLGAVGLTGNVAATAILLKGQRDDINLEGVLRHSAADALGSAGVIVSGAVLLTTGWHAIDPLVSLLIAAVVLASSWRLISEPFDVLMEAAPGEMDVEELGLAMARAEHVREVHDLHVWTVTSGLVALSAHVVVDAGCDRDLVRSELEAMLREHYGIEHTTLQIVPEPSEALLEVDTETGTRSVP